MNLDHLTETLAITRAATRLRAGQPFGNGHGHYFAFNVFHGTKYWDKNANKLNRKLLLDDLAVNPWTIRNIYGVGETTEYEVFRALLATVGEQ